MAQPPAQPQPPAPRFLHDIPSISQKNPGIPPVLGSIDLNRGIVAGDALNYEQVRHARAAAKTLKYLQGKPGFLTRVKAVLIICPTL